MIAAIWKTHCMELWRRWAFLTAFGLVPGIATVGFSATGRGSRHPDVASFLFLFAFFAVMFPARFGGTGLTTSRGGIAACAAGPSLLFTLSLPVRRRALFFYRSVSGLLAMETAVAAAWVIDCFLLVHLGASWHALVPALWVLPALGPLYFLDSLLLIRFSEMTTMQIQVLGLMILVFALRWLGVPFEKMADINLQRFTSLSVALAMCLLSAAVAAIAVWRLDGQSY
jgi:hypothetical protein